MLAGSAAIEAQVASLEQGKGALRAKETELAAREECLGRVRTRT